MPGTVYTQYCTSTVYTLHSTSCPSVRYSTIDHLSYARYITVLTVLMSGTLQYFTAPGTLQYYCSSQCQVHYSTSCPTEVNYSTSSLAVPMPWVNDVHYNTTVAVPMPGM